MNSLLKESKNATPLWNYTACFYFYKDTHPRKERYNVNSGLNLNFRIEQNSFQSSWEPWGLGTYLYNQPSWFLLHRSGEK